MFYFNYVGSLLALTIMIVLLFNNIIKLYKKLRVKGSKIEIKNNIIFIIYGFLAFFMLIYIFPYWMDCPRFITGNYSIIEGVITNIDYWDGKEKYINITINEKTLKYYNYESPAIRREAIVKYLPHTKIIYNIEEKEQTE